MARITINEVSANYSYNVGNNSYCTVALPITSSWGPAFEDPTTLGKTLDEVIETTSFTHFRANQAGLDSFITTYRGPAANYRAAEDFSYQIALSLLTAGYDIDVCRVCPGAHAQVVANASNEGKLAVTAKYPGTFGNSLSFKLIRVASGNYWNIIAYVLNESGTQVAVENKVFVFNIDHSTDAIPHISELDSNFFALTAIGISDDDVTFDAESYSLSGGSDRAADAEPAAMMTQAIQLATARYGRVTSEPSTTQYLSALNAVGTPDKATAATIRYREWVYTYALEVLGIITDKLSYSPNRVIFSWDDMDVHFLTGGSLITTDVIAPAHKVLMMTAYNSRCATAYLDIPKSLPRSEVHSADPDHPGYAQKLATYWDTQSDDGLYATHSALFAPWGQYAYAGTNKQNVASPSFLALMIQRSMILNQSLQYEWAMPTTRSNSVNVGKLDYLVPKKLLDTWQTGEGVSLNVIADIPSLGTSVWGNSTLMNVPPATYNALQNLSTRLLMNAVEDVVFKCGLAITFNYNNEEAYSRFYAGVTPILDTMRNVGAIQKYEVEMSADINSLDSVNANAVLGAIRIWCFGVIDSITVDLVALPVDNT